MSFSSLQCTLNAKLDNFFIFLTYCLLNLFPQLDGTFQKRAQVSDTQSTDYQQDTERRFPKNARESAFQ